MDRTIYSPDPKRIGELKDKEGIELFRDLLYCDALRLRLSNIVISLDTTNPDGGIDAKADKQDSPDAPAVNGSFHFQIKTGKTYKPWQASSVRKELFGSATATPTKARLGHAVRECLDSGGTYILVTLGHDLSATNHTSAENLLRTYFRVCGYQNPAVEVWGQGHLVKMIELYPSLCMDLSDLGDTAFQTLNSWASNSDMAPQLELGESQSKFEQEVRSLMRGDAIQHVRVVGEPGIGKTRLVLEALRSEVDLAARCLYVPQAGAFQGSKLFNELLKADREYWVLLVIDECDESERASIWQALKGRHRLKLITIDHGPEQSADEAMRVLQFPALEQAQIEAILSVYVAHSGDLFNWAAWCEGSARVAHAVGENLKRNPDDLLKSPATVPIWDRFILGYKVRDSTEAERLRVIMRHVALFQKFGFKAPVAEEGQFISAMAAKVDPTITSGRFSSDVKKYIDRRVLQGSHTLRIVPKALHVHLWREWWENYGGTADLVSMMEDMPSTLHKWFLNMFIYANGVASAQQAVRGVLSLDNGPFADKRFLASESGTRFIDTLAEADPGATIELLQATIGKWSSIEVDEWQTGRQNIVFALEKIAVWKDHFSAAAQLLGRMALSEKSTNTNNAKGTLLGLFEFRGGPTQAPPEARLLLATAWLQSGDHRERQLGLELCGACLNFHGGHRIIGVEYQGLKPAIEFWHPKIWDDLYMPWRQALGMLMDQNRTGDAGRKLVTSREIIQRVEGMLSFNILPDEALNLLFELASNADNDLEKLTQVVILKERYHAEGLPQEIVARLEELETQLGEGSFIKRFQRFVVFTVYDEDYTGEGDDFKESDLPDIRMAALAQELLTTPGLLDEQFAMLLQSVGYRISKFGKHFALAAGDDRFDKRLLSLGDSLGALTKPGFVAGYLDGVREINVGRWESLALELLADCRVRKWRALAVIFSGYAPSIVKRLVEVYLDGSIDSTYLRPVALALGKRDIGNKEAATILEALLNRPDEQSSRIALELADYRFCREATRGEDPEETIWRILTANDNFKSDFDTMGEYHWAKLAKRFCQRFPKRNLPLLSAIVTRSARRSGLRSPDSISEVAADICKADPTRAWKIVAKTLTKTGKNGWSLRHWLGDTGSRQSGTSPVIEYFDTKDVMHWMEGNPEERVRWALDFAPRTLAAGRSGDLTRSIIEQYGKDDAVDGGLMGHFESGAYWGPRSQHLSSRRDEVRTWLSANPSVAVQAWIERYIRVLNKEIETAQIAEERQF